MATSSGADRIKLQDHLRKVAVGPNFTTLKPFNNSNNSNSNNNINNNNNNTNKTNHDDNNSRNSYCKGSTLVINCTQQFHNIYA